MTLTNDPILRELANADPVADSHILDPAERDRVLHRATTGRVTTSSYPRMRRRHWATALTAVTSGLAVAVIIAAIALVGVRGSQQSTNGGGGHVVVTRYRIAPAADTTRITSALIARERRFIAARLRLLTSAPIHVALTRVGPTAVALSLRSSHLGQARLSALEGPATATGQVTFYDWEADVLLPDGRPAAPQLLESDPAAAAMSQGGRHTAGSASGGAMTLYRAVELASHQPTRPAPRASLSHTGSWYDGFGAPGSSACRAMAVATGSAGLAAAHCELAGPAPSVSVLRHELPRGVAASAASILEIPQGTAGLPASGLAALAPGSAAARFFVLRDRVALSGADIVQSHAGVEPDGQPDVTFGFTRTGAERFQALTHTIVRRAATLTIGADPVPQHFAIALDGRLLTVATVDMQRYPEGIITQPGARNAAQLTGDMSTSEAQQIAAQLHTGSLPFTLNAIHQS